MRKIFISHSSKDAEQAELVFGWLQVNNYEAFLDSDKDLGIVPGTDWSEQLRISLNECQILIAICSRNYRESDWCRYELDVAYHRCLTIIPILIDDSPPLGILKPTQCISLQKGLQDAQTRLLNGIRHHLASDLGLGWDAKRRPYPGLDPFNEYDEGIFYGREDEIEETVRHLRTIRRERDHCLHLVIGASGSGKSSLVRAGVIPRLKRDEEAWIVLPPFHPGAEPLREWASSISTALSRYNLPRQQQEILQSLQKDPERTMADLVETLRTQSGEQEASLLVTIDQFEELVELRPATTAESPRQQFVPILKSILESKTLAGRLVVVGTLRSDFLDAFQEARYFQSVKSSKQILAPMSRKNFRQVIEKPAELAGIEIEEDLIDAMIEDTETGDALPLLAFTLRELWEKKTNQRQARGAHITITLSDYQQIGGLGGAIQQTAEQIYQDHCSPDQKIQLRDWLLRMVRSNADIDQVGWVKRAALWSEMPPESHAVLDRFVSARLLVKKKANASPHSDSSNAAHEDLLIEPTHEALLRNWERLEGWIRENNDFLIWRDRFNADFIDWQRSSTLNKDHLEGSKLLEAEKWQDKFPSDSPEKQFIQSSVRHRRGKTLAWYALVSGLLAGLAYSLHLWQNAEEAQAYQYKISQATTVDSDPYESGVAGLAAMGRFFLRPGLNYQIARSLEQTITTTLAGTPRIATQFSSIDAITRVSDQRLVVSGTQGQVAALQLIELAADGSLILEGQPTPSKMTRIKSLLANPEHSLLYSLGYADEGIRLGEWSIADQRLIQGKEQTVFPGVAILRDTITLIPAQEPLLVAWAEGDGLNTLLLWSRGEISQKLPGIPPATSFLALRDGTLISAHERGPLRTWKIIANNGKTQLQQDKLIDAGITVASLTHFINQKNEEILVAGGVDGSLSVIRVDKLPQKMDLIRPNKTGQSRLDSLEALPTGEVISGDDQSGIRWWTWQSRPGGKGTLMPASRRVFATGQGAIRALVAIPHQPQSSGNVLSAGADGSLRLLGQEPYALAQPLYPGQTTAASPAALSALTAWPQSGIASAYQDGSICWWGSLAESQKIPTPSCGRLPEGVSSTALAALGSEQELISASTDGLLRWWNKDQTITRTEPQLGGGVSSPIQAMLLLNNSELVTGDSQGALQWWTSEGKPKGSAIPSGADPVRLLVALDSHNLVSVSGIPEQLGWWKNRTLRPLRQDPTQQSRLTSISRWSVRDVMTGGSSGLIQQWREGKRIGDPIQTDHGSGVWAMLKLNSRRFQSAVLLTAGENGQISVWNSGFHTRERGLQPNHETISTGQGKITSLLETNTGDLVSGSEDGSLKITSPSKVVEAACKLYKPMMAQPSSAAEKEASELCTCLPPDQWWNALQWLCFAWKLIS